MRSKKNTPKQSNEEERREREIEKYIDLFEEAFDELHGEVVATAKSERYHVGPHYDYPYMSLLDSGFPSFGEYGFYNETSPRNYLGAARPNSLLGVLAGNQRPTLDLPKGAELAKFLRTHEIGKRLKLETFNNIPLDGPIDRLVGDAVERYIHLHGLDAPIERSRRSSVLRRVYIGSLSRKLELSLVVPITMTHFQIDRFRLSETTYIMRIPKKMQLARARMNTAGTGAVSSVVGAATHAFVSKGWSLDDTDDITHVRASLKRVSQDAIDAIDGFFGALRIATGARTGYSQVLWVPKYWALDYFCDLTPLYGTTLRQYPGEFDNYGWLRAGDSVSREQLLNLRRIYTHILESKSEAIRLALKRLNGCLTRTDAADAILDATIGLELLLGDDENQALSYKLRLRAGALAAIHGNPAYPAKEIVANVKLLYAARSAIVHGLRRKRTKKASEPADIRYTKERRLASDILRFALDVLLAHPKYCDEPTKIDEDLILYTAKALATEGDV